MAEGIGCRQGCGRERGGDGRVAEGIGCQQGGGRGRARSGEGSGEGEGEGGGGAHCHVLAGVLLSFKLSCPLAGGLPIGRWEDATEEVPGKQQPSLYTLSSCT